MLFHRCARAWTMAAIGSALACGSPGPLPTSPGTTTSNRGALVIVGLTATVQPLTTTSQPGLVYLLTYQLHAASHVTFTVTYVDDAGQSGTTTAEADVSRVGP